MAQKVKRLADQLVPDHYDIDLSLDEVKMTFAGKVVLRAKLTKTSASIVLHGKDLDLSSAKVNGETTRYQIAPEDDEIVLNTDRDVIGDVEIEIDFKGKISKHIQGIYPCNFEIDGVKKRLIATQFESHHAREAFPCIDEPAAKATFSLILRTSKSLPVVLSNVDSASTHEQDGLVVNIFEKTPRMSPYLLAFVAGDLHSIEGRTKDGVVVRSWAHSGIEKRHLGFSLDHAIKSIEFFNDYYGTEYPLKKCDQVALPDFEFGAMENWGLVTYRETILLCDPGNRSHAQERFCAMVVSHELSHQWFGNLVTMEWWDDLWLNESFASIMEFVALDGIYPEWKMWEQFVVEDAFVAVTRDVLPGVQSVGVAINHPDEINTIFDPAIVYAKGSRLLNMLRCYIGDNVFREGLRLYFKKHAYQNTTRKDLWSAMSEASGSNISKLMTPWLTQPNLPLLSVETGGDTCLVRQSPFIITKAGKEAEDASEDLWPVPLFSSPHLDTDMLDTSCAEFSVTGFVYINKGSAAHAIVHYTKASDRAEIAAKVSRQQIDPVDRASILNDLVLQARGGLTSISDGLGVALNCGQEGREAVWRSIAYVLEAARVVAEGDDHTEDNLKDLSWKLVEPVVERLGWKKTGDNDTNLNQIRSICVNIASRSDSQTFIEVMHGFYEQYEGRWDKCDSDLRPVVMGAAIEHGFTGAFDNLIAVIRDQNQLPDVRQEAASGLLAARADSEIYRLLDYLKDTDVVRHQDMPKQWFAGLMSNKYARTKTWQWMVDQWSWIEDNFGDTSSYDRFPRTSAATMKTLTELELYEEFFTPKTDDISLKRTIEIGINDIAARVAWRDRDQPQLRTWLSDRSQTTNLRP